jgi:DNA-directed DNA polymerase III PolC
MIQLKNRTEYSFKTAYGPLKKVLSTNQGEAAGICDRHGTWGHVQWEKECKALGIKPIFGVELAVVDDMHKREKQGINYMSFIAKNNEGLSEIYNLATTATEYAYYVPLIDYGEVDKISDNVIILSGNNPDLKKFTPNKNRFIELSPSANKKTINDAVLQGHFLLAVSDNYYTTPEDEAVYQIAMTSPKSATKKDKNTIFSAEMHTHEMHIVSEHELKNIWVDLVGAALINSAAIERCCNVELPTAEMVKPVVKKKLMEMCFDGAERRKIDITAEPYKSRLEKELTLISEKNFEDYFYVVADLVQYCKKIMLVGPARGSSCGSLVCFLLGITDIDPIPYDLIFERFIDVNRKDLPDIDIDFPDTKRDLVFQYLQETYGHDCVSKLGSISRYKPKSSIIKTIKALEIKPWEVSEFKESIQEKDKGDASLGSAIDEAFVGTDLGRKTLEKFPHLKVAGTLEGHCSHTGEHAAAMVVTAKPVNTYCAVDTRTGAAMVDKDDAEVIDLLKIDVLGLRTLSVIEDCLNQIGWSNEDLLAYPLDDKEVFAVLNDKRFSGIFQFEGATLQNLCSQMVVEHFEDMVSLTALARPGPLESGGSAQFVKRRTGNAQVVHMHSTTKPITSNTYGVIVYQEQIMRIAREVGSMSWPEVSKLRKAMAKSMGAEAFEKFYESFKKGALANGLKPDELDLIWNQINKAGSYAFNRSHSVAYGLVSYWCALLKAKHPLEYAVACLRNPKDDGQLVPILRELDAEGYKYKAFDKDKSEFNWSVQDGILVGGLIGVKGIGEKMANAILKKRAEGGELSKGQWNKVNSPVTPYDTLYESKKLWGHIFDNPEQYNISSPFTALSSITDQSNGDVVFIGKITELNQRDLNSSENLKRRNGRKQGGQTSYLSFKAADDTGEIFCGVNNYNFEQYGKPLVEAGKDQWYIFKGFCKPGFRKVHIKRWKRLDSDDYSLKSMT